MEIENEEIKNEIAESPKKHAEFDMSTLNGSPDSPYKKKDK